MTRGLFDALSISALSISAPMIQFLRHRLLTIILVCFGLALAGCEARTAIHGQTVDDAELNQIEPGVTTRAGVIEILGRPSFEGAFNSGKIYYLNDFMVEPAAGRKRMTKRTMIVFVFDANNVVSDVEVRDETSGKIIANLDKKTPTPGDNFTIAEQLFSTLRRRPN